MKQFFEEITYKSRHQRCSVRKGVPRNFAKFTEKHLCQSLFFNKVAGGACNFIKKETLAQVFSCEFCEISKNTFFTEHLWMTASGINSQTIDWLDSLLNRCFLWNRCSCNQGRVFIRLSYLHFLNLYHQPFADVAAALDPPLGLNVNATSMIFLSNFASSVDRVLLKAELRHLVFSFYILIFLT